MARDGWSPGDYQRFAADRRRPFEDLLSLLGPLPDGPRRLLDVGCGTGELTVVAHRRLGAEASVGVDASPEMLARAEVHEGVSFLLAAVPEGLPSGPFEVIVSNSALNWVPDHPAVLAALASRLAPGGQLAIQMPFNPGSAFVGCCAEVAASQDFAAELGGSRYESPVLAPEAYARQLERLGFDEIRAGAWLYPQRHASVEGLVDFARGGLLSAYRGRLAPERFEAFVAAYRAALARELGPGPVFFPFQRVLAWGRRR